MARRRRNDEGLFDLLFDLATEVPVAGIVIAVLIAAVGTYYTWINPKGIYGVGSFIGGIAFLIAVPFGIIGIVGTIRGRRNREVREARLDSILSLDDLRNMDWKQFEQLVADAFRRQGFRVNEVGGSGDGGVDLILIGTDSRERLVQCKQYRVWDVGEPKVREFYGAMAAHRTRCEGIIVTCGRFTEPARAFAAGKPLRLISGEELVSLIRKTNPITPAVRDFTTTPDTRVAPNCPICSTPMVIRTAKKGVRAGQPFWGCRHYPRCRAIINMDS